MYRLNRLNWASPLAAALFCHSFHSSPAESAGNGLISNEYERKELPPELSRNVAELTCESSADGGVCDVYVVGTANFSKESCKQVKDVIEFLKPEVVFLETCSIRGTSLGHKSHDYETLEEVLDVLKMMLHPYSILLSWRYSQAARQLEVTSSEQLRVAYQEAMKYNAKVILGDRPLHITLHRSWAKMPLGHKTKLLYNFLFRWPSPEDIARLVKEREDVDVRFEDAPEGLHINPALVETLVDERDQYMSAELLNVARKHNSVVAVVEKGHIRGIQKYWKQPVEVEQLLNMTVEKNAENLGIKIAVVAAIIYGFYPSIKRIVLRRKFF